MKKITIIIAVLSLTSTAKAENIFISEIMPNPEGKDKNNEWIELYNDSDQTIKLENWQLENKKTQTINVTIPQKSYIILENLKINLRNKDDHIRLLDEGGQFIDEVTYENAKNGQSFSRIKINNEMIKDSWTWTTVSKNTENPTIYKIDLNSEKLPLDYLKGKNTELLRMLISKDRATEILVEKNNDTFKIHDIKMENPFTTKREKWSESWMYYFLIAGLWLLLMIKGIPLYASPHK